MKRRKRGARRRDQRQSEAIKTIQPLLNKLPLVQVLDDEGIEMIHKASMRLLSDVGMLIVDFPPALETFRQNGAKVEGEMVWIDEDTLMHFINQAPETFTLQARNPINNLTIGGENCVFAPIYGPPFVSDYKRGRRTSTIDDFHNFAKLSQMAQDIHLAGGVLCEPNDLVNEERHLDMLLGLITLSDKAFMGSVTHADNARDSITMGEIVFGKASIRQNPGMIMTVNASSPLRYDDRMFSVVEAYSEAGQPCMFTPFIIAGAMSPSTMAATVAQLNAEALFGICYAQMINPGCPAVYGSFLANIDMKSGAPCFGTAENNLAMFAGGQMARYYGIPYRSGGNFTASRIPDAQAGYESAGTMWATIQAGTNFVLHSAGWLEGGLIASYEKFILDLEICAMAARYVKGIGLTDEDFAWDAYDEAGPGEHFLGTAHTMRHYDTAFHQHQSFSMDNYEKWEEEGKVDSYEKAYHIWRKMLRQYKAPPIDEAVRDEIHAFAAFRRAEIQAGKPRSGWESSR
ncbi:MAG: trimethylamine methyltransferase family protein [Chloroflexota bacterium]